jgi:hypothetical protein
MTAKIGGDDLAKRWIKEYENLKGSRANWLDLWQDVADYCVPEKSDIYNSLAPGDRRRKPSTVLFDSVGEHSNKMLASAMHSMLTNPARFWFELTTEDLKLDKEDDVRQWLQDTTRAMHFFLNQSNFHSAVHQYYIDINSFGTGLLRIQEDEEHYFKFISRPVYQHVIAENNSHEIDMVFREFSWTARQVEMEFGRQALPRRVAESDKNNPHEKFRILHAIVPNRKGKKGELSKNKPFLSYYFSMEEQRTLRVGGFEEFPMAVGRFGVSSGEIYGRSPAMQALPDIKLVNKIWETTIRAAQKTINPPLQVPDDGSFLPVNRKPGGITYYRAGGDLIRPLETGGRVDLGIDMINQIKLSIRKSFFIDQLQLVENDRMTATEVNQRTDEQLRFLGPVLSRQEFEFLRPLINRVFGILLRRGKIPAIPKILSGRNVIPRYVSQVARVQRASDADNIVRAITAIGPIIQAQPETLDLIDGDMALKKALEMFGIDQEIIRDEDEIESIRGARADQEAQVQEQEQQQLESEQMKNLIPLAK